MNVVMHKMLMIIVDPLSRTTVYCDKRLFSSITRKGIVRVVFCFLVLFSVYHIVDYFLGYSGIRQHVDPHAVRGYSYCPVNETALSSFESDFTCDFNPSPPDEDVIILTFINSAWINLAKNWMCSAERVGIKDRLFLVAFEPNVCSHFKDIPCYEHPNSHIQSTVFGEPEYQKLVIERTRVLLKLLTCKKRILLADADIVFLKNPLVYLNKVTLDKDVVFQADSSGVGFIDAFLPYFFRYICGGFIYMKPNNATKLLWLSVLHYQTNFKWNDQAGLNICIRHHTQVVEWDTLKGDYFPNGMQFFDYEQRSEHNMIVHANHLANDTLKISRMIASDVWCDKDIAVSMCANQELFQVQCEIEGEPTPAWCFDFLDVCDQQYKVEIV